MSDRAMRGQPCRAHESTKDKPAASRDDEGCARAPSQPGSSPPGLLFGRQPAKVPNCRNGVAADLAHPGCPAADQVWV